MKLKNVCLIRIPNYILYNERLQIPLPLLYLASYLRQNGIEVKICDLAEKLSEEWPDLIPPDFDIYGLSMTTGDVPIGNKIAKLIKTIYPKSLIVGGGAHPSALPLDTIENYNFDIAVYGEGEQTLLEIASNKQLNEINGIWYNINGKLKGNKQRNFTKKLDNLPFPAWDLLDNISGKNLVEFGQEGTCITCSRGCPYDCAFCATHDVFQRTYRTRSFENIYKELEELKENYNIHNIRLVDELVLLNRKHFIQICNAMKTLDIRWRTHSRADLICKNKDLLKLAKDSGMIELAVGIEDPHPDILKTINKRISPDQAEKAVYYIKDVGINSKVYYIIGLPGQSWDTIKYMKEWTKRVDPTHCTLSTFIPYPNSDIYLVPKKYNMKWIKDRTDWKDFWILGTEWTNRGFIMENESMNNNDLLRARRELLEFFIEGGWKEPPPKEYLSKLGRAEDIWKEI